MIFEPSKANAETLVRDTQRTGLVVGWGDVVLDLGGAAHILLYICIYAIYIYSIYPQKIGGIVNKIFRYLLSLLSCNSGHLAWRAQNLGQQSQQSSPKVVYKPIHCHRGCEPSTEALSIYV